MLTALLLAALSATPAPAGHPTGWRAGSPVGERAPGGAPVYKLMIGRGQATAIHRNKPITKCVSGDNRIVKPLPMPRVAVPVVGLRGGEPGVTNVLVWTTDSQVHTYLVTVK